MGWILPHLGDPDGHELRFYTTERHTDARPGGQVRVVEDARETAERLEAQAMESSETER